MNSKRVFKFSGLGLVTKMLEYIDEENIMPPLSVVQVLSRNGVASVGLVKQWLVSRIKESRDEIDTVGLPLILCWSRY